MNRAMVAVDGASDVLAAAAAATSPHHAAQRLRDLAAQLDLGDAREATIAEGRSVVLASEPSGAALALRWFAPDARTTIHDHGSWGAAVVLAGRDRYERFEPRNGVAVLDATLWPEAGDIVWWFDPPHNLHGQSGSDGGVLELIVLGTVAPDEVTRTYAEGDALGPQRPGRRRHAPGLRRTRLRAATRPLCRRGHRRRVHPRMAVPDPRARPCRGAARQRGVRPSRPAAGVIPRLSMLDGCVVEVAVRFNHGDETRRWRDIHVKRRRDGPVTEHLAYCTGHWDAATIARHDAEAPMVRP